MDLFKRPGSDKWQAYCYLWDGTKRRRVLKSTGIVDDGTVKCWGQNSQGQSLTGTSTPIGEHSGQMGDKLVAAAFGSGRHSRALSLGTNHGCAILDDDHVKCWGLNKWGELGYGDTQMRGDTPNTSGDNLGVVNLGSGISAESLATSWYTSCALLSDHRIKCWGSSTRGETAHGDKINVGAAQNQMGDNLAFSAIP
jgi:E3 ubiquitin-protein ligase HERC3